MSIEQPGRALVTGCAGFIGSHLADRLLRDGWTVVGVDAYTDYYARALKSRNVEPFADHPSLSLRELDLSADPIDELLEGVDTIFHLAAQPGVRGSFGRTFDIYVRDNIVATQRLLEAATRRPGIRFVYASSSSVYGDAAGMPTTERAPRRPVSPYGVTKVATEELAGAYARSHDLSTVGLRYFTVYGPRQRPDMAFHRFIRAAIEDRPVKILGDGRQIRDFTFVGDIVDGTVAAGRLQHAEAEARVYNLGGGRPVELREVIEILGQVLGRPVPVEGAERRRGDARHTSADISAAAADLGFAPRTRLEDGLRAQADWILDAARSGVLNA